MRRAITAFAAVIIALLATTSSAAACAALIGPNGAVNLLRTSTFAGYHDGVEHYVTAVQFAGGSGQFGSLVPQPAGVTVPAGLPVTYVIRNEDPIEHEWLVGDAAFHQRHRTGTEAAHGDRPDEVSLPGGATRTTTLTLAPGTYRFICHFPLHEEYGMVGLVTAR